MLTGEYYPTIDANGRLAFPSGLRKDLGERFYITWAKEPFLVVYPEAEFNRIAERINERPMSETMNTRRLLFTSAVFVEPDKQGRAIIPLSLRKLVNITDEVAVLGNMSRAEIWPKDKWLEVKEKQNAPSDDSTFEELGI